MDPYVVSIPICPDIGRTRGAHANSSIIRAFALLTYPLILAPRAGTDLARETVSTHVLLIFYL